MRRILRHQPPLVPEAPRRGRCQRFGRLRREFHCCIGQRRRGCGGRQSDQYLQLERRVPHPSGSRLFGSGQHFVRRHRHHPERRHRDPLDHQPNQDGVYQQKLDEALLNQASGSTDDKVDIFLSETDYVYKYTDAEADVAMPLTDLGIDPTPTWPTSTPSPRPRFGPERVQRGSTCSAARALVYRRDIAKDVLVPMIRPRWAKKSKTGTPSKPPRKS